MEIRKSLNKKNLIETVIKSIIWNTIIDIFKQKKNIDIKEFLISIRFIWDVFLIKTNKPAINNELILLDDIIKKALEEKLQKLRLRQQINLKYK